MNQSHRRGGLASGAIIAAALGAGVLCGCADSPSSGYSFNTTYAEPIRTVHVPMFGNDTFFRGIEFELTEAIVKEIQASTPWRVVGTGNADAVLSGVIEDSDLRFISQGTSGLVQEQGVTVEVDFVLRSTRTGRALVEREGFQGASIFIPAQDVGERIETGQSAAIADLAKAIVAELRSSW